MLKILLFLTLLTTVFCENTDFDALIDQIFGPTTAKAIREPSEAATKVDKANNENTDFDALVDQIFGPTTAKAIQEPDNSATKVDKANKACTTADGFIGECIKIDKNAYLYAVIDEIFGPSTAKVTQDPDNTCITSDGFEGKCVKNEKNADINAVIDDIFGPTTAKVNPAKRAATVEVNETCTTLDGLEGECVVYYLCNATDTNTDQIIDLHLESDCSSYLDVCCHKSHKLPKDHYKTLVKRSPFNEEKENIAANPAVQEPKPPVPADTSNGDLSCETGYLKQGKCVPYYLCKASDISNDGICPSFIDVCCKESATLSLDFIKSRRRRSTYNDVKANQGSGGANTTEDKIITQETDVSVAKINDTQEPTVQSNVELCETDDGKQGECVPYYLCNATNIGNGEGVIDIIVSSKPVCSSNMDICCEKADTTTYGPIKREGCGWANPLGLRSIKESTRETRFGEFPWMVAIFEKVLLVEDNPNSPKLNKYVGGGSLIHPSVVLTVAHNVHDKKEIKIRAGDWDVHTKNEPYPYQDRDVSSIETHKDFIKKTLFYDIALLFLAKPVELAPNVGVVCLQAPRVPQEDGTRCLATGWGKDKFGKEGSYSAVLKKVDLPVVSHDRCENILRMKTRLGEMFTLHSTFMCAGGEKDKDTCTGDGGSPLSCPIEENRFIQSGIVAWGVGCGQDGVPSVYVDVSTLRDWIDDKVIGKGYDPKVYTYALKDTY